jgi:hypothetical protein
VESAAVATGRGVGLAKEPRALLLLMIVDCEVQVHISNDELILMTTARCVSAATALWRAAGASIVLRQVKSRQSQVNNPDKAKSSSKGEEQGHRDHKSTGLGGGGWGAKGSCINASVL